MVETDRRSYEVSTTVGIKALKENLLRRIDHAELESDIVLFSQDSPRRMALIQEQISGIKD